MKHLAAILGACRHLFKFICFVWGLALMGEAIHPDVDLTRTVCFGIGAILVYLFINDPETQPKKP